VGSPPVSIDSAAWRDILIQSKVSRGVGLACRLVGCVGLRGAAEATTLGLTWGGLGSCWVVDACVCAGEGGVSVKGRGRRSRGCPHPPHHFLSVLSKGRGVLFMAVPSLQARVASQERRKQGFILPLPSPPRGLCLSTVPRTHATAQLKPCPSPRACKGKGGRGFVWE